MAYDTTQWPLHLECLEEPKTTEVYEQVIAAYIPMDAMRPGAQTFKDLKNTTTDERLMSSGWRLYMDVFEGIAQEAYRLRGAKCKVKFEQIMHEDLGAQRTMGYHYFLLYSPPPPLPVDANNPNGEEVVKQENNSLDWIAYRDIIGHFQTGDQVTADPAVPAEDEATKKTRARLFSSTSNFRSNQMWRKLRSYEDWADYVSLVTGFNHVKLGTGNQPSLSVSLFDFSPRTGFAMRQNDVCAAQSLQRLLPSLNSDGGSYLSEDFETSKQVCISWPDPRRVYTISPDVIKDGSMFKRMLPHCQKVRAETACQLSILLPRMVKACATEIGGFDPDADEDGDVEMLPEPDYYLHELEQKRDQLMGHTTRCVNKRQRLEQTIAAHKHFTNNSSATTAETPAERKKAATPYHPIAAATTDVHIKCVKHIAPFDQVTARKLSIVSQQAALSSYEMQSMYSPLMSNAMRAILDAIDRDNLLEITESKRNYFRRPKNLKHSANGLSPLACYHRKFLVGMECLKHMNHLHRYCLMAEMCALDSVRFALDIHLHLLLMSHNGGIGKSLIWQIIQLLMIAGTVVTPTYRTGAASTAADKAGNYNYGSDCVVNMDELGSSSMSSKSGESNELVSRLKYELSNGCIEVEGMTFDDEGNRVAMLEFIVRSLVYMASSNALYLDRALGRRWWLPVMPEQPTGKRHPIDAMNQAALDPKEIKAVDSFMQDVYHTMHAVIAHVEKMIQSGILPEPSDDICGILSLALTGRLRENQFYIEPNITVFQRLRIIARQQCIQAAIMDAFFMTRPTSGARIVAPPVTKITPELILQHLPRRLFVTTEHFVFAVGMLSDEIMDPLEVGIRVAITTIFKERSTTGLPLMEQFFTSTVRSRSKDSATGFQQDQKTDYNYISFDMRHLIQTITMILPTIMNGFHTNAVTIRKVLDDFVERKVFCRSYDHVEDTIVEGQGPRIRESEQGSRKIFAAARKVDQQYLVHCHFLVFQETVDALNADVDTARGCSPTGGVLKQVLEQFLSAKCMFPRQFAFGPRADNPADMFSFSVNAAEQQKPGESDREFDARMELWDAERPDNLNVSLVTYANDDTFEIFPELQEMIPDSNRLKQTELLIDKDLDTLALEWHNEKMFVTSDPVSKTFRQGLMFQQPELSQVLGGDSNSLPPDNHSTGLPRTSIMEPTGPHFAGSPLHRVSQDEYLRWVSESMPDILESMKKPSEGVLLDDVDFEPHEFMYYGLLDDGKTVDPVVRAHWYEVAHDFPPESFGFDRWHTEEPEQLARQYKLIAFHPVVREHLYQELGI